MPRSRRSRRPRFRRNPSAMPAATVLYRAVSLPEFVHVMRTGKFSGGANVFNSFDKRRFVFFGDTLDSDLIHQGEEIERQSQYVLRDDPMHERYTALREASRNEMRPWNTRQKASRDAEKLQKSFLTKHGRVMARIRKVLSKLPLSSVVFETIPLVGAEMFSGSESGMSGAEYGFGSNEVTVYDVAKVWLVKNGKITGSITIDEARELARRLEGKLW